MPSTITDRIDGLTTSVAVKAPVVAATTANIMLTGEQTIDTVAVAAGDRVLVKDQTVTSENGIYKVSTTAWSRAKDFNGARDAVTGTLIWDNFRGVFYTVSTSGIITIGTTSITFSANLFSSIDRIIGNILHIGRNIYSASFSQFLDSAYLVLDKKTEEDDASTVYREGGAVKWELGATTELPNDSSDFHLKRVTGAAGSETFTDVLIWKYDTGDGYVVDGFKFGIGTIPVELLHVAKDNSTSRTIVKIENSNSSGGSESAAITLAGANSNWSFGNDFGLNGGDNWFIQGSSLSMFGTDTGVAIGGSTLADTEVFRMNSTTGGMLLPRMTTTQRDAMGGKNAGLVIYNTTTNQAELWNSAAWTALTNTTGTFANADATPSVAGGGVFKTANTGATTITDLDDFPAGGRVTIIFDDANTTIDFTGTDLKGNAGVNWSPALGDHMDCVSFSGLTIYCAISDNTA